MSRYELIRLSGLAGIASGLLIIAGAVALPSAEPVVFGTLFVSGHILLFFLLTGVYSIQYSATGLIGLLGYALSMIANALFVAIQAADSFVLSRVVVSEDLFPAAAPATVAIFTIGLLLLAIANSRTRALMPLMGWLMFLGMALNLVLPRLVVAPPEFVFAIPPALVGLGAAGFGWALRSN